MPSTQTFLWKRPFENHRYRILFVDDHLYALNSVSKILEKAGYVVYTAQTADKALAILNNTHIHLGIFDLNLAGESELISDPEPQNYEGLDLATRSKFPFLRIVYTGKRDTGTMVSALNHTQTVDYILKGEDSEETLLQKVNTALVERLPINQDLGLHWQNTSLQEIVQRVYPGLSIEQQMEHILELEDLFRIQFIDFTGEVFEQVTIADITTDKPGRVWLKVSAYTGEGRKIDNLVLVGKRETLILEDSNFDSLSPEYYQIRSEPMVTIHYGIHAYEVFDDNLPHIHTLAHYLLKKDDELVATVLDKVHSKRFQNQYRNSQSKEKGTLYQLASGKGSTPAWTVTEALFEVAGRIASEWQHIMPRIRLNITQNQMRYDEQVYPHPIVHLETLFNYEVTRPVGMTHGDLRVNSIFANANNGEIYLFDYTDAGESSLLRDYVSLERSIHIEVMSQISIENYQTLGTILAGSDDDLSSLAPDLQRAVYHIRQIRELALRDTGCESLDYLQDLYVDFVNYLLTYPQGRFAGYETVRDYAHCLVFAGQICHDLKQSGTLKLETQANGDGVLLDSEKYRVRIFGKTVDLTEKQYGLFEYLYNNIEQNCTYADIIEKGLHEELMHDDIKLEKPRIQTAVSRLRPEVKKFGFRIESWRNGYRLIREDS